MTKNSLLCNVNNSSAKHQFSFSKADRFASPKRQTNAFAHINPHYFHTPQAGGRGSGFNSSENRFFNVRKQNSDKIDGPGQKDRNGTAFKETQQFSFGVSRVGMKKVYVEEILTNKDNHPAPTHYTLRSSFGQGGDGSRFSMRPKLDLFHQHLKKQAQLPGPGHHVIGDNLDLAGRVQTCSKLQNQPRNAFPTSADRFSRTLTATPDPTKYKPAHDFEHNVKSSFKCRGRTRFGKNTLTFMDHLWAPKERANTPAPGHYKSFSEFSGMVH